VLSCFATLCSFPWKFAKWLDILLSVLFAIAGSILTGLATNDPPAVCFAADCRDTWHYIKRYWDYSCSCGKLLKFLKIQAEGFGAAVEGRQAPERSI
jgi:hypothetical protein